MTIIQKGEPMTDTELKRRKAICEAAHVDEIDDVSDGFHTFRQLYYQRMMLFAAIVKQNKDKAWKSLRHEDGELCFGGGWFIVGIDTPEGSYTYHYENNYFSLFDCEELERGKHWDGHTEKDVTRLLSLSPAQPEPCEDAVSREAVSSWLKQYGQDVLHGKYKFSLMYIWKNLMDLPSAQPETAKRIVGKSRDGMTLWYQCDMCNEPVDVQDSFCRGCGRRLIDERSDWQTGGD